MADYDADELDKRLIKSLDLAVELGANPVTIMENINLPLDPDELHSALVVCVPKSNYTVFCDRYYEIWKQ